MIIKSNYINEEEQFIADLLSQAYPDKDFGPNSNFRDLIVRPIATISAILKLYITQSNQIANLLAYDQASFGGDIQKATEATLKNWLLSPRVGARATGFVYATVTSYETIVIPNSTKFIKNNKIYYINSPAAITIPAATLTPNFNSDGSVASYNTPLIPIIAETSGSSYNLKDGDKIDSWSSFVPPSIISFTVYGNMLNGTDDELPTSARDRLYDALVARNAISSKSIKTTILSVANDVLDVIPIGYKDPEMVRNKIVLYNHWYRIGGFDDVYIFRPPVLTIKEGTVGEPFETSSDIIPPAKFMIVKGVNSIPANLDKAYAKVKLDPMNEYWKKGYSDTYIINRIYGVNNGDLVLEIAPNCLEEYNFDPGEVTIGINGEDYDDIINDKTIIITTSANLVNSVSIDYPILSIEKVEVYDPNNANADPNTGYITLTKTNNDAPGLSEYKLIIPDPKVYNSYGNSAQIMFNPSHNAKRYRITYYTFNMSDVVNSVENPLGIDRLIRAKYFSHLKLFIQVNMLEGLSLNIDNVKTAIGDLVNSFDFKNNILNCDAIKTILFNAGAEKVLIGANYSIQAPTGKVVYFASSGDIVMDADHLDATTIDGDMRDLIGVSNRLIHFYIDPTVDIDLVIV